MAMCRSFRPVSQRPAPPYLPATPSEQQRNCISSLHSLQLPACRQTHLELHSESCHPATPSCSTQTGLANTLHQCHNSSCSKAHGIVSQPACSEAPQRAASAQNTSTPRRHTAALSIRFKLLQLVVLLCTCAPVQLVHAAQAGPVLLSTSHNGLHRALRAAAPHAMDPIGPQMLANCMLPRQDNPPLTWSRAMRDEMGTLQVQAMWWSRKESLLPITVVTQLSASRLSQLSAQCRAWRGPLSAAVYIPLLQSDAGHADHGEGDDRDRRRERHLQGFDAAPEGEEVKNDMGPGRGARARVRGWKAGSRLESNLKLVVEDLDSELRSAQVPAADPVSMSRQVLVHNSQTLSARPDTSHLTPRNLELLQLAEQAVAALHEASERLDWACQLDVVLVYEVLGDARTATLLYPVNQLRNLARLQARTELIAQLDVDMLLSHQLYTWLNEDNNEARMVEACRNKVVYVLPAFQAHGANVSHEASLADHYITQPKDQVKLAMDNKVLHHFDALRFPQGHNTTNFPRWFGTNKPYPITYTYRFEPWLIVHRRLAPWHDVRFRGYGNNKIQQVCHLNATGYTFMVHPAAFIIHRAHALTEARKQLITDLRGHLQAMRRPGGVVNNGTLYGHTKHLFEAAKEQMDAGVFAPALDPATLTCIGSLPWYAAKR